MAMTKNQSYDGHDARFNGKVDAVVDLRQPGNPAVFARKDGAGADGDFIEGTVGIRTRNGLLVVSVMEFDEYEDFDVSYRVDEEAKRVVTAEDGLAIEVDDNARDLAVFGMVAGQRIEMEDAKPDGFQTETKRVQGRQGVHLLIVQVDKEADDA